MTCGSFVFKRRFNSSVKYPTVPIAPERLEDNIAVWAEMNELRVKYDGLSLGEGAPGYPPP